MAEAAPSLLKGAVIALLICLGLPLLMLLSIPCNLFGSPSASSADIREMTAQAEQLTVTWKDQRTLEDKAINVFVDLLPENLGFISVEKNLGNTNDYWMVAITSVYSEQDVMLIDEDKIVQTMQAKLKYELKAKYDSEGNFEGYVLVISDMTPTELMDKLGFDEMQRMWAEVIQSTIADAEYSAPSGSSDNTAGMDFSDIVFTGRGNSKDVVYFSQYDSRWGSLMYGKTNTIAGAGCGPTSLAICVSTLTNKTVLPPEICDWSVKTGHRCEGSGSYHSLIPDGAAYYSVPCRGIGQSKTELVKALQEGKLVIAIMSAGHFTRGGHTPPEPEPPQPPEPPSEQPPDPPDPKPKTGWGDLSSLPRYPLIYPDEDGYNTTGTRGIRLSDAQVDAIQGTLDTMRNDEKTNYNNKGDAAL